MVSYGQYVAIAPNPRQSKFNMKTKEYQEFYSINHMGLYISAHVSSVIVLNGLHIFIVKYANHNGSDISSYNTWHKDKSTFGNSPKY